MPMFHNLEIKKHTWAKGKIKMKFWSRNSKKKNTPKSMRHRVTKVYETKSNYR